MTFEEFLILLQNVHPPKAMNSLLLVLWHDAKGDWEKSHSIASEIDTKEGSLLHAYLHRKEGDLWNADYWYKRAGTKRINSSLDEEWKLLVQKFLTTE